MKLTTAVSSLALAVTPLSTAAWCGSGRPYYSSMVRPVVVFSPAAATEMRQKFISRRRGFTQSSPRYEITDDDEMFQVAVDVPGMSANDISITVEDDGHLLSIKGTRQSKNNVYSTSSKFAQSFSLDPSVDVDKFTAKLENGVLIIAAPKDLKRIEENIRSIPIMTVMEKEEATVAVTGTKSDTAVGVTKADEAEEETAKSSAEEGIESEEEKRTEPEEE